MVPMPGLWIVVWFAALAGMVALLCATFWLQVRLRRMARRNLELEEAASLLDPLTGLHNRRYLDSFLALESEGACRAFRDMLAAGQDTTASREDILLYLLSLDQFNEINETWGRPAGDAVLLQLARAVKSATRKSDFRIRWEGDTFLVVARRARRSEASTVARNLMALARGLTFQLPGGVQVRKRISIGYAALPLHPNHPELGDWQAGVAMAEQCLRAAKLTGRDRWVGAMVEPGAAPGRFTGPEAWSVASALDQRLVRVRCSEPDFIWPARSC